MGTKKKFSYKIFDFATIVTMAGLFLYVLGMIYMKSYYNELKVPGSLLDLSVNNVISRTWFFIAYAVLGLLPIYGHLFIHNYGKKKVIVNHCIFFVIASIIVFVFELLGYGSKSQNRITICAVLGLLPFALGLLFYRRIKGTKKISKNYVLVQVSVIATIICMFIYNRTGYYEGHKCKIEYEEDIELTLNHDNLKIYGKWILFSNDKYILLIENDKCDKETVIIDKEEVYRVKMIPNTVFY
ncbi:hypothetical protein [Flavobacterium ginsenosidimutans]|uniref:hypothetical protein n=1 Tax=Flavobacterium ginsenosidimutans TaxID=687844 RepID=UPI003D986D19